MCCKTILDSNAHDAEALHLLAVVTEKQGQATKAIKLVERAIKLNGAAAHFHHSLGIMLTRTDDLSSALAPFNRAAALDPNNAAYQESLGATLLNLGRVVESLDPLAAAQRLSPEGRISKWNLAKAQLALTKFSKGWKTYDEARNTNRLPDPPPDSDPPFKGKKLIVYAEQGVGEEIMFASCYPDAMAAADSCVLRCTDRLAPLFARSFPAAKIELVGDDPRRAWQEVIHPGEVHLLVGSLPRFLRRNMNQFPDQTHYLVPDSTQVAMWRHRFAALGRQPNIGISWRGGASVADKKKRLIKLNTWSPIFNVREANFVNLQYGDCADEIARLKKTQRTIIHDWDDADPLVNLDGQAAQIAALDLVITTSNTTAHLAGALGIPAWVMAPTVPNWNWFLEGDTVPWYRSVKMFRQEIAGDWDVVIQMVATELKGLQT